MCSSKWSSTKTSCDGHGRGRQRPYGVHDGRGSNIAAGAAGSAPTDGRDGTTTTSQNKPVSYDRIGHFDMETQEVRDGLGWPASHAALSRHAKIGDCPPSGGDTPLRSVESVMEVDQSEVELRLWM